MIGKINKLGRKSKAIVYAVGVHLLVIVILGVSFNWKSHLIAAPAGQEQEIQPVQATVVPEAVLDEELAKLQQRDELKKKEEEEQKQRVEDLIDKAEEIEAKRKEKEEELAKIEEKRKSEEEEAKRIAQERKKEEERLAKIKLEEEQRKKEEERKKKEEEERLIAERKRKEEEDRKKKEQAEKERLAKIEAEKKRKAEEERKRQQRLAEEQRKREEELQQRLAAERIRGEAKAALVGNIGAIQRKVSRNWLQPQSFRPGQTAKVQVKVSPTGEILDAKIVSGSGDPIFDRSVFNAVMKSSPLPIPQDSRYYPHIQTFNFLFSPYG